MATGTLGAGQVPGHSVEERLDIVQFQQGSHIGVQQVVGRNRPHPTWADLPEGRER